MAAHPVSLSRTQERPNRVHRDGLALVASSALSSAVGLLYWVVAARLFPPDVLGVNSVAVSTLMMLGTVAQLNMTYALLRFVPVAGTAARRLVGYGYLVGAGVAGLAGCGFAIGAPVWAPELVDVAGHGALVVFFTVAVPLWAIFVMQDFVLTATGRATTVPVISLIFSVLKIVLLGAAAYVAIPGGVALSWVAATLLMVVAVNAWLLLRVVPAHGRATADRAVPVTVRGVARFVRADYAGAVFWQAALFGMPVLVLARLGPEAAAAYGIAWTIAQSLYTVASGMGQSTVAHTAADPSRVEQARRAMVRRTLMLVGPAAAVLAVGAPVILRIFGAHYAEEASLALVLAALSAVPNVVTASTVSAARIRQRMGVLFAVPASVATLMGVLSWLLMPLLGITAVGLAWLVAQCVVAGAILVLTAPWLPPLLGPVVHAVRSAVLLRRARLFALTQSETADANWWVLGERMAGGSDSVVVGMSAPDSAAALLKVTDSDKGRRALQRQTAVLAALHADSRLGDWRRLVPRILEARQVNGSYAVLETKMPGEPGGRALADPARRRLFISSAITTICELHRRTFTPVTVGKAQLGRWLHAPMAQIVEVLPRSRRVDARHLERVLADRLRGRTAAAAWTHGDYTPANVLTDPEGRVVAVVDWCQGCADGLPVLDVVAFQLTAQMMAEEQEIGAIVLERLRESRPHDYELFARVQRNLDSEVLDYRLVLVLAWLQHVAQNVQKSSSYAANPIWMRRNVVAVLRDAARWLDTRDGTVALSAGGV